MKAGSCFLVVWLWGSFLSVSLAQVDTNQAVGKNRRGKAIHVEALGNSATYLSLNYDMCFKPGRKGWGFNAGMALPFREGQAVTHLFPLLLNRLSSERRVALEAGVGIVLVYRRLEYEDTYFVIQRRHSWLYPGVGNFGVRFQPLRTGVIWRLYWAPSWEWGSSNPFSPIWFGTSLGIGFK